MNFHIAAVTILAASVLMHGCSSSSSDDSNEAGMAKYNGNYLSGCEFVSDDNLYEIDMITIQGNSATSITQNYTDADCTIPDDRNEFSVSLVYPGGTTETPLGVADHVDVTINRILVNGEELTEDQAILPITFYDIFLLDGAMLYFGDDTGVNNGDTEEARPTELESVALIRQ